MKVTTEKLKDLLVRPGHISEADFSLASTESKKKKKDIAEILIEKNLIRDEQLGRLIADELGYNFVNLRKEKIDQLLLDAIPEIVASSKGVIAFNKSNGEIKVGMTNPNDLEVKHLLEKRLSGPVNPYYITPRDLEEALLHYRAELKDEFEKTFQRLKDKTLSREESDSITVQIVNLLLQYGYENKASDIHIEPYAKKMLIRFRIDGVLHDVLDVPRLLSELILARIKILAKMRTDVHRSAQDGKLRFKSGSETVDVRVSIVPVTQGENVVMRLLSSKSRQFSLVDLGLGGEDLKKVKKTIRFPHGMILVTGPTGSGKTTTLYAILKILNKREVHISTIEDPVEYDIEGISQIQANTKTNLTFAKGLRAIVRQDPDIIMIGEIRDEETAGIAVNSALTGHLVLSTLHTNDAATTLPRLLDMKIEPFLVGSTVSIVIAQRLVRKICQKCRVSYTLREKDKKALRSGPHVQEILKAKKGKNLDKLRLYHGDGCKVCNNTGFTGRIGVFEVLEMTDKIKELVVQRASSDKITALAISQGMSTMLEDGLDKVLNGQTTLEEVLRVTRG